MSLGKRKQKQGGWGGGGQYAGYRRTHLDKARRGEKSVLHLMCDLDMIYKMF